MARFHYLLAGDKISSMFEAYGIKDSIDGDDRAPVELQEFEDEMIRAKCADSSFEDLEVEVKEGLKNYGVPFAVVFMDAKIYAYISLEKTATFEVI